MQHCDKPKADINIEKSYLCSSLRENDRISNTSFPNDMQDYHLTIETGKYLSTQNTCNTSACSSSILSPKQNSNSNNFPGHWPMLKKSNAIGPINLSSTNHIRKSPTAFSAGKPFTSHEKSSKELEPVGVFWDFENCPVPKGKSAQAVVQKIRNVFFQNKREAEFMCVCDTSKEKKSVIEELNKAQVRKYYRCGLVKVFIYGIAQ